jgi:hypothetical protein
LAILADIEFDSPRCLASACDVASHFCANGGTAPQGPVDPEAELGAIAAGNIHTTQLRTTSALLRAGASVAETVAEVLAATERVGDPTWSWTKKQRKIERLCFDFVAKNPELSGTLPDTLRRAFEALVAQGSEPKFRCGRDGTWGLNYTPPQGVGVVPKPKTSRLRFTTFDAAEISDEPEFSSMGSCRVRASAWSMRR